MGTAQQLPSLLIASSSHCHYKNPIRTHRQTPAKAELYKFQVSLDQNLYFVVRFVTSIHKTEVNLYFWTLPSSLRSIKYELPCESATEW